MNISFDFTSFNSEISDISVDIFFFDVSISGDEEKIVFEKEYLS